MASKKKIFIFENTHTLTNYLLKVWVETAQKAVASRGFFSAAVTGGHTPVEFYCKLSGLSSFDAWSQTRVFLTDERFVPFDHPDSNYGMIKENLFDYVHLPAENVVPIRTDVDTPQQAAENYEKEIRGVFQCADGQIPALDFMLLGLGPDGHVASLFPGHAACEENRRLAVSVSGPQLPSPRVSMTFPLINQAKNIIFYVTGKRKANIVYDLFETKADYPAARVAPVEGDIVYLLDKAAADQLAIGPDCEHHDQAVVIHY